MSRQNSSVLVSVSFEAESEDSAGNVRLDALLLPLRAGPGPGAALVWVFFPRPGAALVFSRVANSTSFRTPFCFFSFAASLARRSVYKNVVAPFATRLQMSTAWLDSMLIVQSLEIESSLFVTVSSSSRRGQKGQSADLEPFSKCRHMGNVSQLSATIPQKTAWNSKAAPA